MPLPRKSISVLSSSIVHAGADSMKKKLMNDIMYYLRKLIKLGRRLQNLQIRESVEDASILEEFEKLAKEVDELEQNMQ